MTQINKILILFFPILFALPELAINVGPINLRYDDLIIYVLFLLNLSSIIKGVHYFVKNRFYQKQLILVFYSIMSLLVVYLTDNEYLISNYEMIRSLGSIPFLIVLPLILSNQKSRKYFYIGAFFAGFIYIASLSQNYSAIVNEGLEIAGKSFSFKKEVSFSTLNPNSVAILAVILGWIGILAHMEYKKKIILVGPILLMLVPMFVFARAMSVGVVIAFIYIVLSSNLSFKKVVGSTFGILVFYLFITKVIDSTLFKSATDVNILTGEGFSNRYIYWEQGLDIALRAPIFGHGFATDNGLFIKYFNGHMSHNLILHYLIELGLVGLLIFAVSMFYLFQNRYKLARKTNDLFYRIQIAILISFIVADTAQQLLYINKYAFLIYALATLNKNRAIKQKM